MAQPQKQPTPGIGTFEHFIDVPETQLSEGSMDAANLAVSLRKVLIERALEPLVQALAEGKLESAMIQIDKWTQRQVGVTFPRFGIQLTTMETLQMARATDKLLVQASTQKAVVHVYEWEPAAGPTMLGHARSFYIDQIEPGMGDGWQPFTPRPQDVQPYVPMPYHVRRNTPQLGGAEFLREGDPIPEDALFTHRLHPDELRRRLNFGPVNPQAQIGQWPHDRMAGADLRELAAMGIQELDEIRPSVRHTDQELADIFMHTGRLEHLPSDPEEYARLVEQWPDGQPQVARHDGGRGGQLPGICVHQGHARTKPLDCRRCGPHWRRVKAQSEQAQQQGQIAMGDRGGYQLPSSCLDAWHDESKPLDCPKCGGHWRAIKAAVEHVQSDQPSEADS